jgi:hypothetical protein
MKTIKIKPITCTIRIPMFATEQELKKAEAKKTRLENAGYNLVISKANELVYRLPC